MREIKLTDKNVGEIVIGMGFFDCVHLGHRALVSEIKMLAQNMKAHSAIITFSNNPYAQFNPSAKLIYTYNERLQLFYELGLDYVIPFEFNADFRAKTKETFLKELFSAFEIKGMVCGYDYKFGHLGSGNADYLKAVCAKRGIPVSVVQPVLYEKERVSSTLIKKTLMDGDIKRANELLDAPYFLTGQVVHGRGVGKIYGIPTANIEISSDKILVKSGVYATRAIYDGKVKKSVTNVGAKPTFGEKTTTIETLVKDESSDLYGKDIKLEFVDYLRDIRKFDSPEELADRIHKDLEY